MENNPLISPSLRSSTRTRLSTSTHVHKLPEVSPRWRDYPGASGGLLSEELELADHHDAYSAPHQTGDREKSLQPPTGIGIVGVRPRHCTNLGRNCNIELPGCRGKVLRRGALPYLSKG